MNSPTIVLACLLLWSTELRDVHSYATEKYPSRQTADLPTPSPRHAKEHNAVVSRTWTERKNGNGASSRDPRLRSASTRDGEESQALARQQQQQLPGHATREGSYHPPERARELVNSVEVSGVSESFFGEFKR